MPSPSKICYESSRYVTERKRRRNILIGEAKMTSYSPDGTGRDSYIIHKNGGLKYQQPNAEYNKTFVNRLRDYSSFEISYTGRGYNPETGIGITSKPNKMIK